MLWPFLKGKLPKVSVIIPCFNQGLYLADAVRSVSAQTLQDFEIIVVNDGSTDPETQKILEKFSAPKTRIIHSPNRGVSAARNLGISHARGRYILPLDCDDMIAPMYLAQAAALLDAEPRLGIVYCKAEFFGFQTGPWVLAKYSFPECLIRPSIFCTAMFRRADWKNTSGYNTALKDGFEDHDFWLELIKRGREVHCIDEVLFYYRRMPNSVTHALTFEKHVGAVMKIFSRHRQLFVDNIETLFRGYLARETVAEAHSVFPIIQLFFDAGRSYNEFDSLRTRYSSGEWAVVDLPVPPAAHTRRLPLRLDPGMQAGCYDISEIALVYADGVQKLTGPFERQTVLLKVEGTALMLPWGDGLRILSYGSDPQILLHGLPIAGTPIFLRIKIRFQASIETAGESLKLLAGEMESLGIPIQTLTPPMPKSAVAMLTTDLLIR